ncbi:MAG: methyl-accepting chemotaxis protein [Desulfovibrionaceae bacterium]
MQRSILAKLILVVVLALVLEGLFFGVYFNFDLKNFSVERAAKTREMIYQEKQFSLRDLVEMADSTLQRFYNQSQDMAALKQAKADQLKKIIDAVHHQLTSYYAAHKDTMGRAELLTQLQELVRDVRYDGDNYIWINDTHPSMVMHPINPKLDGKDLSTYADKKGTKLFVEMVKVSKASPEGGLVSYMWEKPGETVTKPKVSFVRLLPELDWIIGTGAWVEDITEGMKQEALLQINKMRLANGNYFWVTDTDTRMVMHPTNPALNGKDMTDNKDAKGKQLFKEMTEVAMRDGDGVVQYWWGKPGQDGTFPKVSYVKLFKPWGWIVGMGVYMDDVDALVTQEQQTFDESLGSHLTRAMLYGALFVILIVAYIIWQIRRDLNAPMNQLVGFAAEVAAGDLNATVKDVGFKGEILRLKNSVESMVQSLKAKMGEAEEKSRQAEAEAERARKATEEADEARKMAESAKREGMLQAAEHLEGIVERLSSASEELSVQADEIHTGTDLQKQRLSETATSMEEMNATVLEVAQNAASASENADQAKHLAQDGESVVAQSMDAIKTVLDLAMELKQNTEQLGSQAEAIGKIINVINDIADQTNLLALNAAIEAARAGEAGRGFAVVADEVRKLAEKTTDATKEVGDSIRAIQDSSRKNAGSVEKAVEAVESATELANKSGESLRHIVQISESTSDQVRSIATASEEQSAASEEINRTIEEVNVIAIKTAEGMTESTVALQEMASQASALMELIEQMKRENT